MNRSSIKGTNMGHEIYIPTSDSSFRGSKLEVGDIVCHLCLHVSHPAHAITSSVLESLLVALWALLWCSVTNSIAPTVEKIPLVPCHLQCLAVSKHPINICVMSHWAVEWECRTCWQAENSTTFLKDVIGNDLVLWTLAVQILESTCWNEESFIQKLFGQIFAFLACTN